MSMESDKSVEPHFLEHPEAREVFEASDDLLKESDRGAVLIALGYVDMHLERLYRAAAPKELGRKTVDRLLKHPGPLCGVAAKVDLAVVCRLISPELGRAINQLRGLRNKAAHSTSGGFRLRDHQESLSRAYDLGPRVPHWINITALRVLLDSAIAAVLTIPHPMKQQPEPVFSEPREVLDFLRAKPELLAPLQEKVPRMELAIAMAMMCALILQYRVDLETRSGEVETGSSGDMDK